MTASNGKRRSILPPGALGALLVLVLAGQGADGAESVDPPNRLEQPVADLAILPSTDPDATPRLLVLDGVAADPAVARLEVLERDTAWNAVATIDLDLGEDHDARWLIGLGGDRFVLVATTGGGGPSAARSVIIGLDVETGSAGIALVETDRRSFDRAIDAAGAPDTDGDSRAELMVHFRPGPMRDRTCVRSDLIVLDGSTFATTTELSLAGPRLGAGVIGRWDEVNGDDLLVYAGIDCPIGDDHGAAQLLAIRLRDGITIRTLDLGMPRSLTPLSPPLRFDLDGTAPDEALAQTALGLSILDPMAAWTATQVGSGTAIPLVAGPAAEGGRRIAWMEPGSAGGIATKRLQRGPAASIIVDGGSALVRSDLDPDRWRLISEAALSAAARHAPAAAWIGDALEAGCPDLVVPAAIQPCSEPGLRSGAAWFATRPVAVMTIEGRRRLLVAAGLAWDPTAGLPPTPTPWASGPSGWWRHGPSAPFAISEVRARDVAYFREFPTPNASVDDTTAADASTALSGFTGTRLFVMAIALAEGEDRPTGPASALDALVGAGGEGEAGIVVRVPVAPGLESGRDGSFARFSLADVTLADGAPAGRWAVRIVPINDWGEVGLPAVGVISRDTTGPRLSLALPFVSPIWPVEARLHGAAEPGSTVEIVGRDAPIELDRRGRFVIDTTLAPWPQDLRLTAVDASGNRTETEVSVIGGIDYRRLPWAPLGALALLLLVAVRGLGTSGPARVVAGVVGGARWAPAGSDDGPVPEIEELPPGAGLPRG